MGWTHWSLNCLHPLNDRSHRPTHFTDTTNPPCIHSYKQVVTVSWVQPRVLSQAQIATLAKRLEGWTQKVGETLAYVEDQTPELFN
jgi:hypothetical protein